MKGRFLILGAVLAAALQVFLLWQMIEGRAAILRDGVEVRLKTVPVDPRDLLRGKYVRLNYDISQVNASLFQGDTPAGRRTKRPVYVVLAKQADGFWGVVAVHPESPENLKPGQVVVETQRGAFFRFGAPTSRQTVRLSYGIERFYVPEGDAIEIENQYRDRNTPVDVIAAVSPDGAIQIKRLIIDGKPVYEEPLY